MYSIEEYKNNPILPKDDWAVCPECGSKPGSPLLCKICLHNQDVVCALKKECSDLKEELDRDKKLIKALINKLNL